MMFGMNIGKAKHFSAKQLRLHGAFQSYNTWT